MSRASERAPGTLQIRFRGDEHKPLASLRQRASTWLSGVGDISVRRDDVLLVLTELVQNAFRHGDPGPTTIALTAVDRGRGVEVTVSNTAPTGAVPQPRSWRLPGGMGASGRGLAIVAALSHSCRVQHRDGRVLVTVRLAAG